MIIEIEVTKEMLDAVRRRQYLLKNANNHEEIPSDVWNRDFDKAQSDLAHSLAWAVEMSGADYLDLE